MGYANIFVTAPSPDNLKTLFEFTVVGLQQMEYKVSCTPASHATRCLNAGDSPARMPGTYSLILYYFWRQFYSLKSNAFPP